MPTMDERLAARMARPQRHRLLQGYPPLPLMRRAGADGRRRMLDGSLQSAAGEVVEPPWVALDPSRPLLVGVLPHAMCNPTRRGCGFCTFPHQPYSKRACAQTLARVLGSAAHLTTQEGVQGRKVAAVYFGGATANLAPMSELQGIANLLAKPLDLAGAEVTVEGTASNFRGWPFSPLSRLADFPGRHKRISLGVQTFDPAWLAKMGRTLFGGRDVVGKVVADARKRKLSTSADILFNLPGQTLEQMLEDVRTAFDLGFEQVCLYHLVLHPELGTQWSQDRQMLDALPPLEKACENACALREAMLAAGYVQTTLTNFERADANEGPDRFVYEELSFPPEACDGLGIGPNGISTFLDLARRRGVKLARGVEQVDWPSQLWFPYEEADLKLLFLTRGLARTRVSRERHRRLFGADFVDENGDALRAITEAKLASLEGDDLVLTPRGMFFADSVAGLLAEERVEALRPRAAGVHNREHVEQIRLSMG